MSPQSKVSNLFPRVELMNGPHSARFGTARKFTKKAPRPNVNASYRNKVNNGMATEESLTRGVAAANQAILSRLNRLHPGTKQSILHERELAMYRSPYGGSRKRRNTRRTRKGTRKYRR